MVRNKHFFLFTLIFLLFFLIGEGAYSSVYKVRRIADSNEYALKKVKLMNLSEKERQNALNEVRILASIRHQNIICYKEVFMDEATNSLWFFYLIKFAIY